MIASDPARPALPLAERAERLFAPGSEAVAVFSAEGALLYATGELDGETTLATLGAESLKADAIAAGQATGETAIGPLTLTRLGSGTTTVLVATLPEGVPESAPAPVDEPAAPHAARRARPRPRPQPRRTEHRLPRPRPPLKLRRPRPRPLPKPRPAAEAPPPHAEAPPAEAARRHRRRPASRN